ncbi:MAG: Z1 domain-containing protein [Chromatiaceae bacterium]|nr:Z1 domain-containing protein [Chromatiaceae bacterium]
MDDSVSKAELMENIIATAQRLIKAEKDKSKITTTFIKEKVSVATTIFAGASPELVNQDQAVTTLIQRFSHRIGKSTTLRDDANHIDWLSASRKRDWQYWRRYQDYLESKLSDVVVEGLDEATDEILTLLEDPRREDSWDRRGLVVGHVQSGKTSNYSGLICKAADAGYKIIIVLAGMHNNLRSQTQIRLEESFLGYETTVDRDPGKPIGVAEFGGDLKTNSATTRAENGDFNKAIAKHFHGISPEERPWLFVVKKQKTVLTALLRWIQTRVADAVDQNDGRNLVTKLPLLMIDDEADNASVDTGEQLFKEDGTPDEEHQPKTINSLIRQILHAFTRKAYVGYTATPFANIFIHQKGATLKEGPDVFPSSFIINLAAPSNYIGPSRFFGKITKEGRADGLPLSRFISDVYDDESKQGWMPPSHKRTHIPSFAGEETIPPSLLEAIYSFILACVTRQIRGQGNEHCSMLIHVTRFVDVQKHVYDQVQATVRVIRQRIVRGIGSEEILESLRLLWESDFIPTRDQVASLVPPEELPQDMPKWSEVLRVLPEVIEDIEVRAINGTAKDALDYVTEGAALKVIAVGGDKLSRGLTLEGLCTSYFVRTTKMYDTLMQMGRWFGYRPGYLDLCRLYTSPELVTWFGHIADASEELREEFDFMSAAKLTPVQYGLKVLSHKVMMVTSPLKMRNSQKIALSYSGTRPQTILFHRDPKIQQLNLDAADALIQSLGNDFIPTPKYIRNGSPENWPSSRLWKDVDVSKVLDFLGNYTTHPAATSANASVLQEFISKMVDSGQLKKWSVALLGGGNGDGDEHTFPGGEPTKSYFIRKTDDPEDQALQDPSKFSIGVLTDPKDEGIDLDDESWEKALKITQEAWHLDHARGRDEPPKTPSGKGIREIRGKVGGDINRGLLLIYPLSPKHANGKLKEKYIVPEWTKPIIAFAIAFPSSDNAISVTYDVNNLFWSQEHG